MRENRTEKHNHDDKHKYIHSLLLVRPNINEATTISRVNLIGFLTVEQYGDISQGMCSIGVANIRFDSSNTFTRQNVGEMNRS